MYLRPPTCSKCERSALAKHAIKVETIVAAAALPGGGQLPRRTPASPLSNPPARSGHMDGDSLGRTIASLVAELHAAARVAEAGGKAGASRLSSGRARLLRALAAVSCGEGGDMPPEEAAKVLRDSVQALALKPAAPSERQAGVQVSVQLLRHWDGIVSAQEWASAALSCMRAGLVECGTLLREGDILVLPQLADLALRAGDLLLAQLQSSATENCPPDRSMARTWAGHVVEMLELSSGAAAPPARSPMLAGLLNGLLRTLRAILAAYMRTVYEMCGGRWGSPPDFVAVLSGSGSVEPSSDEGKAWSEAKSLETMLKAAAVASRRLMKAWGSDGSPMDPRVREAETAIASSAAAMAGTHSQLHPSLTELTCEARHCATRCMLGLADLAALGGDWEASAAFLHDAAADRQHAPSLKFASAFESLRLAVRRACCVPLGASAGDFPVISTKGGLWECVVSSVTKCVDVATTSSSPVVKELRCLASAVEFIVLAASDSTRALAVAGDAVSRLRLRCADAGQACQVAVFRGLCGRSARSHFCHSPALALNDSSRAVALGERLARAHSAGAGRLDSHVRSALCHGLLQLAGLASVPRQPAASRESDGAGALRVEGCAPTEASRCSDSSALAPQPALALVAPSSGADPPQTAQSSSSSASSAAKAEPPRQAAVAMQAIDLASSLVPGHDTLTHELVALRRLQLLQYAGKPRLGDLVRHGVAMLQRRSTTLPTAIAVAAITLAAHGSLSKTHTEVPVEQVARVCASALVAGCDSRQGELCSTSAAHVAAVCDLLVSLKQRNLALQVLRQICTGSLPVPSAWRHQLGPLSRILRLAASAEQDSETSRDFLLACLAAVEECAPSLACHQLDLPRPAQASVSEDRRVTAEALSRLLAAVLFPDSELEAAVIGCIAACCAAEPDAGVVGQLHQGLSACRELARERRRDSSSSTRRSKSGAAHAGSPHPDSALPAPGRCSSFAVGMLAARLVVRASHFVWRRDVVQAAQHILASPASLALSAELAGAEAVIRCAAVISKVVTTLEWLEAGATVEGLGSEELSRKVSALRALLKTESSTEGRAGGTHCVNCGRVFWAASRALLKLSALDMSADLLELSAEWLGDQSPCPVSDLATVLFGVMDIRRHCPASFDQACSLAASLCENHSAAFPRFVAEAAGVLAFNEALGCLTTGSDGRGKRLLRACLALAESSETLRAFKAQIRSALGLPPDTEGIADVLGSCKAARPFSAGQESGAEMLADRSPHAGGLARAPIRPGGNGSPLACRTRSQTSSPHVSVGCSRPASTDHDAEPADAGNGLPGLEPTEPAASERPPDAQQALGQPSSKRPRRCAPEPGDPA